MATGRVQGGEVEVAAVERFECAANAHTVGLAEHGEPQAVRVALADPRHDQLAAFLELVLVEDRLHAFGEGARQAHEIERLV